jgi:D-alanyl-D-alanine carboxypeptidase
MFSYRTTFAFIIVLTAAIALLAGCSSKPADQTATVTPSSNPTAPSTVKGGEAAATAKPSTGTPSASGTPSNLSGKGTVKPGNQQPDAIQVVANPTAVTVLVNKRFRLPEGYAPAPLVEPNVAFIFKEKLEKRKMSKEAAAALEQLFAGAKKDGISLAGVSGYRSEKTQTTLFNNYAKKDGLEAANTYSAKPGFSEHQTGLVMDVSGSSGKCAAESCFADTKEAKWLNMASSFAICRGKSPLPAINTSPGIFVM